MSLLLTADWHLTDNPADEYRWAVFADAAEVAEQERCDEINILGDLTDRKDRHSALLVNRVISELRGLLRKGFRVNILIGNHDIPLNGPPFWAALNDAFGPKSGLRVIDKPHLDTGARKMWLPYAANPHEVWPDLRGAHIDMIFMHQTVNGADYGNGRTAEGHEALPVWPPRADIYSGDIHIPQKVGRVIYVGAPHPQDFGDTHPCRFLIIRDNGALIKEVPLYSIRKDILNMRIGYKVPHRIRGRLRSDAVADTVAFLDKQPHETGDQVRIRVTLPYSALETWPLAEQRIREWAADRQVVVASVDVSVEGGASTGGEAVSEPVSSAPEAVLTAFCERDGIEGPARDKGLSLLAETP